MLHFSFDKLTKILTIKFDNDDEEINYNHLFKYKYREGNKLYFSIDEYLSIEDKIANFLANNLNYCLVNMCFGNAMTRHGEWENPFFKICLDAFPKHDLLKFEKSELIESELMKKLYLIQLRGGLMNKYYEMINENLYFFIRNDWFVMYGDDSFGDLFVAAHIDVGFVVTGDSHSDMMATCLEGFLQFEREMEFIDN